MNKEDLKWFFKKVEEKVYYSNEIKRLRNIEKTFLEELLGEDKVKEIYRYAKTCGLDTAWESNRLHLNRMLQTEVIRKLMREYLNE